MLVPTWFRRIPSHDLESFVKELLPELKRYQREGELKREIISKVIDDIPEFIPNDFLVVLKEIQDYRE